MIWFWSTLLVTAIAVLSTANESSSGQEKLAVESILFVFAHPDDESMFFGPTIDYLGNQHSTRVHVLCLSNGNADGLGSVREKELVVAASKYQIDKTNVHVVSDPQLQDGMQAKWDPTDVAKHISQIIERYNIKTLITFDNKGISGHPNHIACYEGAMKIVKATPQVQVFVLESVNIFRKYISYLDTIPTLVQSQAGRNDTIIIHADRKSTQRIRDAMVRGHKSQMVWFRYGWIYLSKYMSNNVLKRAT
ncbi:putative N-acetylglucosaminyl-phosphatidylinositol de-N-acetylase [Schizosaccharomyces pombe]|uniref:Probable N-acetylglucosaminyl-phosphatidylinositol de-N-acetylase n=1 Tax=Schizosaccharomyces pombe (strain 972 / ATCC 24843) TaxID=284812 RepID=GPI12_SCHPO|nr:putative pig-L family GPI synthesis protein [Schizosaccharomyces pombe]Q9HDW9.1 RecName: Full=Probable N-acetylglucosaminyl-phosphatidylinositol de-N-acetylase [Schizosaccharomyces pombe 972h-]CAC21467.1 pig-L, N-acetylglucosaminylphosphatidyl inositoldeacetylase (predicted) [Schizosaccharomyces pombe]|eukprot:NP_593887.1 putative pig-L family GPI synthesis protein [Schizosaccharomyces pombe]